MEKANLTKKVLFLLKDHFGIEEPSIDKKIKDDLGLDSLDVVELIVLVERETDLVINDVIAAETVKEFIDKIYELYEMSKV